MKGMSDCRILALALGSLGFPHCGASRWQVLFRCVHVRGNNGDGTVRRVFFLLDTSPRL